jgi:hypothetical protein
MKHRRASGLGLLGLSGTNQGFVGHPAAFLNLLAFSGAVLVFLMPSEAGWGIVSNNTIIIIIIIIIVGAIRKPMTVVAHVWFKHSELSTKWPPPRCHACPASGACVGKSPPHAPASGTLSHETPETCSYA